MVGGEPGRRAGERALEGEGLARDGGLGEEIRMWVGGEEEGVGGTGRRRESRGRPGQRGSEKVRAGH
jgi:hypothetical protein